jgi:lysophospholipase L1-like esterase
LVESLLRSRGFPEVEVINAGIPNHASWDAVGRLLGEGHLFQPDYILLYAAWNDIKYFRGTKPLLRAYAIGDVPFHPQLDYYGRLDRFLCESLQTYVRLRSRFLKWRKRSGLEGAIPEEEPPAEVQDSAVAQYRLNIATFVDLTRNIGAHAVLMTQARLPTPESPEEQRARIGYHWVGMDHDTLVAAFAATDAALGAVAAEKGADLIDAARALSGQDELFGDHIHLSAEGSRRLAELTADRLAGLLQKERPGADPGR